MNVGKAIKDRRKQIGMSAETLAEKIGVSPTTIYRYEKGDIEKVDSTKLMPIAAALGVTPGYLMGWESYDETEAEPAQPPRDEINMSPAKLDRWIMLSNAFNEMSTPEFEMWFNAIRANHPEFFNERIDDDDPES